MKMPALAGAVVLLATLGIAAHAQTVYKLIGKDGKVTYSGEAPKDFDGKVIRIDVNPNENRATLPVYRRDEAKGGDEAKAGAAPGNEARVRQSKEKLESAQKALAQARDNPAEGEVQRVGKVGGGTRPVPTEAYRERLQALERAVKEAEHELEQAQQGR